MQFLAIFLWSYTTLAASNSLCTALHLIHLFTMLWILGKQLLRRSHTLTGSAHPGRNTRGGGYKGEDIWVSRSQLPILAGSFSKTWFLTSLFHLITFPSLSSPLLFLISSLSSLSLLLPLSEISSLLLSFDQLNRTNLNQIHSKYPENLRKELSKWRTFKSPRRFTPVWRTSRRQTRQARCHCGFPIRIGVAEISPGSCGQEMVTKAYVRQTDWTDWL